MVQNKKVDRDTGWEQPPFAPVFYPGGQALLPSWSIPWGHLWPWESPGSAGFQEPLIQQLIDVIKARFFGLSLLLSHFFLSGSVRLTPRCPSRSVGLVYIAEALGKARISLSCLFFRVRKTSPTPLSFTSRGPELQRMYMSAFVVGGGCLRPAPVPHPRPWH